MLVVFGGYDYDVYVQCRTCRAILWVTQGELTIADLVELEEAHEHDA